MRQLLVNIGKGLIAGLAGTAAMTVVSTLEMNLRDRGPSTTPADAAGKVLGIRLEDEDSRIRFGNLVHWLYGTGWGAARGIIASAGMSGGAATSLHFAKVWGTGLILLPALDVAPPPNEWGAKELALDALHHVVYAAAAGAVYDALDAA